MFSGGEFAYYYVFLPLRFSLSLSLPTGNNNNNNHNNNNLVEREREKKGKKIQYTILYISIHVHDVGRINVEKITPHRSPSHVQVSFLIFSRKKVFFFSFLFYDPHQFLFTSFFFFLTFVPLSCCSVVFQLYTHMGQAKKEKEMRGKQVHVSSIQRRTYTCRMQL